MNLTYLLIGGNLGDRLHNLETARNFIKKETGIIIKQSSIYETAAWGKTDQPDFLNQVLLLKTKFSASDLLPLLLSIENKMGRIRTLKNASRIIDIDILFFNDEVIHLTGLTIPHPEIHNRKFALIPLAEIAADLVHPALGKRITELLSTSKDTLEVKRLGKG